MSILREDVDAGKVDIVGGDDGEADPQGPPGQTPRGGLAPHGISAYRLGRDIGVPANR